VNLAACGALPSSPENRTWYRAIDINYLPSALQTAHTRASSSRYNPGPLLLPADQFEILYLAGDPVTALFEFQAVFGDPASPIPNPRVSATVLNVRVVLHAIYDLTDFADAQVPLSTTAQELTGDWRGYQARGPHRPIPLPVGQAPTQELGTHIFRSGIEGLLTLSAKMPTNQNLVIFPQNLRSGSTVTYTDSSGRILHHIP
jgi:RES domain